MKITFLRHWQSTYNVFGSSSKDCHITEHGKEQASKIENYFDIIVCSTLLRAKQTLENSNLKSKKVYFSNLCREQIKDISDIKMTEDDNLIYESKEDLLHRIEKLKEFLKIFPDDKKILVISHSEIIFNIVDNHLNNCEMIEFELY